MGKTNRVVTLDKVLASLWLRALEWGDDRKKLGETSVQVTYTISSSIQTFWASEPVGTWCILVWMSERHAPSLLSSRKQKQSNSNNKNNPCFVICCLLAGQAKKKKKRWDLWHILFLCFCHLSLIRTASFVSKHLNCWSLCVCYYPASSRCHCLWPVQWEIPHGVCPYPLWVNSPAFYLAFGMIFQERLSDHVSVLTFHRFHVKKKFFTKFCITQSFLIFYPYSVPLAIQGHVVLSCTRRDPSEFRD